MATYLQDREVIINAIVTFEAESPKNIDLTQYVPAKDRESVVLSDFLKVAGEMVGVWLAQVDTIRDSHDPSKVGEIFADHLAANIGLTLVKTPFTSITEKRKQLENAMDWIKDKGTYQSLVSTALVNGMSVNIVDYYINNAGASQSDPESGLPKPGTRYTSLPTLYSDFQNYVGFLVLSSEDWFTASENGEFHAKNQESRTPNLTGNFVKTPHFGFEVVLDKVYIHEDGTTYFWGSDQIEKVSQMVDNGRAIHLVPHKGIFLLAETFENGTEFVTPFGVGTTDVKSTTVKSGWEGTNLAFDTKENRKVKDGDADQIVTGTPADVVADEPALSFDRSPVVLRFDSQGDLGAVTRWKLGTPVDGGGHIVWLSDMAEASVYTEGDFDGHTPDEQWFATPDSLHPDLNWQSSGFQILNAYKQFGQAGVYAFGAPTLWNRDFQPDDVYDGSELNNSEMETSVESTEWQAVGAYRQNAFVSNFGTPGVYFDPNGYARFTVSDSSSKRWAFRLWETDLEFFNTVFSVNAPHSQFKLTASDPGQFSLRYSKIGTITELASGPNNGIPRGAVCAFGSFWTCSYFHDEVQRYNKDTLEIEATISTHPYDKVDQMIAAFGSIWAVSDSTYGHKIFRIDPATNAIVASIDFVGGSSAVAATSEYLFLCTGGPSTIVVVDPNSNTIVGTPTSLGEDSVTRMSVGGTISGDKELIWLSVTDSVLMIYFDHDINAPVQQDSIPAAGWNQTTAYVDGGFLWIGPSSDREYAIKVNISNKHEVRRISIPNSAQKFFIQGNYGWFMAQIPSEIYKINMLTGEVVGAIQVMDIPYWMDNDGSAIYVASDLGNGAGHVSKWDMSNIRLLITESVTIAPIPVPVQSPVSYYWDVEVTDLFNRLIVTVNGDAAFDVERYFGRRENCEAIFTVAGTGEIQKIDPTVSLGHAALNTNMLVDDGTYLWAVTDDGGGSVALIHKINKVTGEVIAVIGEHGEFDLGIYGIALGGGYLWIAKDIDLEDGGNKTALLKMDPNTMQILGQALLTYKATGVLYAFNNVWVATKSPWGGSGPGSGSGMYQIDPESLAVLALVENGFTGGPIDISTDGSRLVILVDQGYLHTVDPVTLAVSSRSVGFTGATTAKAVWDGTLFWINHNNTTLYTLNPLTYALVEISNDWPGDLKGIAFNGTHVLVSSGSSIFAFEASTSALAGSLTDYAFTDLGAVASRIGEDSWVLDENGTVYHLVDHIMEYGRYTAITNFEQDKLVYPKESTALIDLGYGGPRRYKASLSLEDIANNNAYLILRSDATAANALKIGLKRSDSVFPAIAQVTHLFTDNDTSATTLYLKINGQQIFSVNLAEGDVEYNNPLPILFMCALNGGSAGMEIHQKSQERIYALEDVDYSVQINGGTVFSYRATDYANVAKLDIAGFGFPINLAYGGGFIWVTDANAHTVTKVDPVTGGVVLATADLGGQMEGIDYGLGFVWAVNDTLNLLYKMDPTDLSILASYDIGTGVFGAACKCSDTYVYVVCTAIGKVKKIDPSTGTVVSTITVGGSPDNGIAYDSRGFMYVPCRNENVAKIDTTTDAVTLISVGAYPASTMDACVGDNYIYVSDLGASVIRKIDKVTNAVVGSISLAGLTGPYGIDFNNGKIAVACSGNKVLAIIDAVTEEIISVTDVRGTGDAMPAYLKWGGTRVFVATQSGIVARVAPAPVSATVVATALMNQINAESTIAVVATLEGIAPDQDLILTSKEKSSFTVTVAGDITDTTIQASDRFTQYVEGRTVSPGTQDVVCAPHSFPIVATFKEYDGITNPLGAGYPQYPTIVVTSTSPGLGFEIEVGASYYSSRVQEVVLNGGTGIGSTTWEPYLQVESTNTSKYPSGVVGSLLVHNVSTGAPQSWEVEVIDMGSLVEIYLNGVLEFSFNDGDFLTNTFFGLQGVTYSADSVPHFSNVFVDTLRSSGAGFFFSDNNPLEGDIDRVYQEGKNVIYEFVVPANDSYVKSGIAQMGLYLADNTTLRIASVFPPIDKTAEFLMRVRTVVHGGQL